MAKDKKSFVLYCDLISNIDHLTNEEKGMLFTHLLEYVNDKNPVLEDRLILTAWKPIERQLKRDLIKFKDVKAKRSEAGKESARLRALNKAQNKSTNSTSVESVEHSSTNPTVNENDNENVNDINTNVFKGVYSKFEFFEDWNELREKHLKKPSHIKSMSGYDFSEFKSLSKSYTREDFRFALEGLFRQKKMPKDISSMQTNPTHFLKFFNSYITAYHDKNNSLYGKTSQEI